MSIKKPPINPPIRPQSVRRGGPVAISQPLIKQAAPIRRRHNIIQHPQETKIIRRNNGMITEGLFRAELVSQVSELLFDVNTTNNVCIEFKNVGTEKWDHNTRLAPSNPRDRNSIFATDDWIAPSRVMALQKEVLPGEIAKFSFTMRTSDKTRGMLTENFSLVQEGLSWFDNTPTSFISLQIKTKAFFNKTKILYLSCHPTLEYAEVSLLTKLGYDVFPVGFYTHPIPTDPTRMGEDIKNNPYLYDKFMFYFKDTFNPGHPIQLNEDFVSSFDIIINCQYIENLHFNWELFKNKLVIWRTIGLSDALFERMFTEYRERGLKIVRISPTEDKIIGNIGSDALIRCPVDSNYFNGWTGEEQKILTVQKRMKTREYDGFDTTWFSMFNEYESITNKFASQRLLCGKENANVPYAKYNVDEHTLQNYRKTSRVYLSLASRRACLTFTFVEAMLTGMPVVSAGKKLAGYESFEAPDFIENGINGFVSNDINEIQKYIQLLLTDYELAKTISINARQSMLNTFNEENIMNDWKRFFAAYGFTNNLIRSENNVA